MVFDCSDIRVGKVILGINPCDITFFQSIHNSAHLSLLSISQRYNHHIHNKHVSWLSYLTIMLKTPL